MKADQYFIREQPKQPKANPVCVERVISPQEAFYFKGMREELVRVVKRDMARQLAEYIIEESQLFELPQDFRPGTRVRFELTINDRGTYENWLPIERKAGLEEGVKQTVAIIPYGWEPNCFYE